MGKGEKDLNQFELSWNFTVEIQLQHNLAFGICFVLILFWDFVINYCLLLH